MTPAGLDPPPAWPVASEPHDRDSSPAHTPPGPRALPASLRPTTSPSLGPGGSSFMQRLLLNLAIWAFPPGVKGTGAEVRAGGSALGVG